MLSHSLKVMQLYNNNTLCVFVFTTNLIVFHSLAVSRNFSFSSRAFKWLITFCHCQCIDVNKERKEKNIHLKNHRDLKISLTLFTVPSTHQTFQINQISARTTKIWERESREHKSERKKSDRLGQI